MGRADYSQHMVEGKNYIELTLDLKEPAELYDVVRSFTSLARQFDEYVKAEHPNLDGEAKIYVKDIRHGSIIADLVPFIQPLIQNMDSALIIDGFVRRYGGLLMRYVRGDRFEAAKKSDLDDFMGQVAAIAKDPDGSLAISSAEFHQTQRTTRARVVFNTNDARRIEAAASMHRKELEAKAYEVYKNVLLVFWQSNLKESELGKRTGEKAIVEEVTKTPLAVVYDSDLAEERIKHETKDGDRNLYKLGFYVDCRVERLNGRPVAYRISEVRDIIELPDE